MENKPADQPTPPLETSVVEERKTSRLPVVILSVLLMVVLGVTGFLAYQNFQLRKKQVTPSLAMPTANSSTPSFTNNSVPSSDGRLCELTTDRGIDIKYYGDGGEKHYISNTSFPTDESGNNITFTTNQLFNGSHYYFWYESNPLTSDLPEASAYTVEEAHSLLLDESFQLREVQDNPDSCTEWKVDPKKLTPPDDVDFTTTEMMFEQFKEANDEAIARLCEVCLSEFSTKEEQLECFSIGNIFYQQPDDVVEEGFNQYCFGE